MEDPKDKIGRRIRFLEAMRAMNKDAAAEAAIRAKRAACTHSYGIAGGFSECSNCEV